MSRPVKPPARGRLTLQQAADLSGLGYQRVYVLVTTGQVPGEQDASGVWTVSRKDAAKIKRREPAAPDGRKAVMLRPGMARYQAWEKAAGGRAVSSWLAGLADAASGWEGEE